MNPLPANPWRFRPMPGVWGSPQGPGRRAGLLLAAGLVTLTACRGRDISFDCETQRLRFNDRSDQDDQPLLETIPTSGPYPVALQITSEGINKLLVNVVGQDVPFRGTVPFGVLPQGPADASFAPAGPPEIRFEDVPGCPQCVIFHLDFTVGLASPDMPLSSGVGFVDLRVPLRLQRDDASGTSSLIAEYAKATIGEWYLTVYGFDSESHPTLAGALKILLTEQIAANYGDLELIQIGSWELGRGDVQLVVRDLQLHNDLDKLVLGMHTNLPLDRSVGLDVSEALPNGSIMAVSMDPDLMLFVAHRMLSEGEIARLYNEDGQPDPNGIYGVTLEDIIADAEGNESLETRFKMWRVDDGYCGFAEASMPLFIASDPDHKSIVVTPGGAVLVAGEGSGAAALQERELVEENRHLIDRFRRDLAQQISNTINYEAIGVEDNTLLFSNQGFDASPAELRTYLDFIVLANE